MAFEVSSDLSGNVYLTVPNPDNNPDNANNYGVSVLIQPDPERTYCLDYLASVTSNDTFVVQRDSGILKKITTNADDKSADILQKLIQTAFVGISQNPNFSIDRSSTAPSLGPTLKFSGAVDPFDHQAVARVNDAIKAYGLCLFLDGEPITPSRDDVQSYCEHPLAWQPPSPWSPDVRHAGRYNRAPAKRKGMEEETKAGPPSYSQGVFYRPRLPYTYYLYVKDNLKLRNVRGAWKLRGTATVFLENASPIFSVGVDRTFFASRQTTLVFDSGALQDITISKGSELANAATIPLQIAQSIAALPANIVQVKVKQDTSAAELINAQAQLIQAQRQYQKDLQSYNAPVPQNAPATGSTNVSSASGGLSQCVAGCLNSGQGTETSCQQVCSAKGFAQ
jgi:hypothetical protein